jgi:hypothetical protein
VTPTLDSASHRRCAVTALIYSPGSMKICVGALNHGTPADSTIVVEQMRSRHRLCLSKRIWTVYIYSSNEWVVRQLNILFATSLCLELGFYILSMFVI